MPKIDTVALDSMAIWTAGEVCAYFRIGRDTLRKYMAEGLPYLKIAGTYKFEKAKVKKFFERQCR